MRARARVKYTYVRRSHLNLTDLNLTVASPNAKPPNLIHRQYFRLYGITQGELQRREDAIK